MQRCKEKQAHTRAGGVTSGKCKSQLANVITRRGDKWRRRSSSGIWKIPQKSHDGPRLRPPAGTKSPPLWTPSVERRHGRFSLTNGRIFQISRDERSGTAWQLKARFRAAEWRFPKPLLLHVIGVFPHVTCIQLVCCAFEVTCFQATSPSPSAPDIWTLKRVIFWERGFNYWTVPNSTFNKGKIGISIISAWVSPPSLLAMVMLTLKHFCNYLKLRQKK